jgi:nitrogen fixation protein FixH
VLRGTAGVRASSGAALQPDPSGIRRVKLRLTRNAGGRCSAYSNRRERFVTRPCGARHGWYFTVATRSDWRYLLPARLPRGRYVLDVKATDGAFNVDRTRRRGENRVVFRVR